MTRAPNQPHNVQAIAPKVKVGYQSGTVVLDVGRVPKNEG
jgi:hypothetical protein